jgi:hypothetical protein
VLCMLVLPGYETCRLQETVLPRFRCRFSALSVLLYTPGLCTIQLRTTALVYVREQVTMISLRWRVQCSLPQVVCCVRAHQVLLTRHVIFKTLVESADGPFLVRASWHCVQDAASMAAQSILETSPTWQHGGQVPAQTDCGGSIMDGNADSLSPARFRLGHTADPETTPELSRRGTLLEGAISTQLSSQRSRRQSSISGKEPSWSFRSQRGQNTTV